LDLSLECFWELYFSLIEQPHLSPSQASGGAASTMLIIACPSKFSLGDKHTVAETLFLHGDYATHAQIKHIARQQYLSIQ
jgi:hypothetical protein